MTRGLILFVALCALEARSVPSDAGTQASSDPCTLCSGSKKVTCPTCTGKGRASTECQTCRGVAKTTCGFCNYKPEFRAKMKLKRGWHPCPSQYCTKGVVTWEGGEDKGPCRVCDGKGTYRCPMCNEGLRSCFGCSGRARLEGTCRDCAGGGTLPCPGCSVSPKSKACPFCHDGRKRSCQLCDAASGRRVNSAGTVKCVKCAGAGATPCEECQAFGRIPCASCGGTGTKRMVVVGTGSKAGKMTDDVCKGVGWDKCEHCKSGKVPCVECKSGERAVACSGCADTRIVVCHGCRPGAWSAHETCGRILHAASRFDDALKFYASALRTASAMTVDDLSDDAEIRRALQAWKTTARERIEAEISAAEQKKPPPPAGK